MSASLRHNGPIAAARADERLDPYTSAPVRAQGASRRVSRRACLAGASALAAALGRGARASTSPTLRLGILQFGTVQWVADTIRRRGLDDKHGVAIETKILANTEAGRIALMAGGVDVVVADWLFAAKQRSGGTKLSFVPFSSAAGGVMVQADSPIRGLADLVGRKLGVAGGPTDKSWVLMQAASRKKGIDLANAARVNYAAPPLLEAKLQQGELDAILTYWNFAARLEAQGAREIASVADGERDLGFSGKAALVGYVFREAWAEANRPALDGFLAASRDAETILAQQDAAWQEIRPLMNAGDDAQFKRLRARFLDGVVPPDARAAQEGDATRLLAILNEVGGPRAADGLAELPPGLFWRVGNAA